MSARFQIVMLLLLAALVLSSGFGLRDPWPADEPRFALAAKQMVESGNWLFPQRGNELYSDKPPLFMWAIAAVYSISDNMRLSFLLPSLLAALGTLWLVIDLGSRLWNRQTGLLAGIILLCTFQFALQARTAQIDALLTFFTTLAVYGLCRHLLSRPAWIWYWLAFAAMGLGVMTKGVGFLPAFILIPYALARVLRWPGQVRIKGRYWQWLLGPVVMTMVIAVWLLPMLITVASSSDPALTAYRDDLLWRQTIDRYADSWHHIRPWWYLPIQSLGLWLPVTLFLPWLIPAWWRVLRDRDSRYFLLLGWIVLVVLFFSIPDGKRGVYLLPATPALALITAPVMNAYQYHSNVRRMALFSTVILAVSILGTALILGYLFPQVGERLLENYPLNPWPLFIATGSVGLLIAALSARRNPLAGLATFFFCGWLLYGWWGYQIVNPVRSAAPFMASVYKRLGADDELGMVDWKEQFLLESEKPAKTFGYSRTRRDQAKAAANWVQAASNRWLLVSERAMQPCFGKQEAIDLGIRHRRRWFLLDARAAESVCR